MIPFGRPQIIDINGQPARKPSTLEEQLLAGTTMRVYVEPGTDGYEAHVLLAIGKDGIAVNARGRSITQAFTNVIAGLVMAARQVSQKQANTPHEVKAGA